MKKIVLIHGNNTLRWSYAWTPWLKDQFERLGVEVIAETFPDSILAREKYWMKFLEDKLDVNEGTILIGHSSGAACAMRYAERYKICGSVLIGAAYTDLGDEMERQSGYFDRPWNWQQIKGHQEWIVQFASTDDPYIPIDEARHVSKMLETEYYEFRNRGHFFKNQKQFSELLEVLKGKLGL